MNEIASVFTSISAYESWILDQANQQPLNCIETNRPTTISAAMVCMCLYTYRFGSKIFGQQTKIDRYIMLSLNIKIWSE